MERYPNCVRCGRNYVHRDWVLESFVNGKYYMTCPRYTPRAPLHKRVLTRILRILR